MTLNLDLSLEKVTGFRRFSNGKEEFIKRNNRSFPIVKEARRFERERLREICRQRSKNRLDEWVDIFGVPLEIGDRIVTSCKFSPWRAPSTVERFVVDIYYDSVHTISVFDKLTDNPNRKLNKFVHIQTKKPKLCYESEVTEGRAYSLNKYRRKSLQFCFVDLMWLGTPEHQEVLFIAKNFERIKKAVRNHGVEGLREIKRSL